MLCQWCVGQPLNNLLVSDRSSTSVWTVDTNSNLHCRVEGKSFFGGRALCRDLSTRHWWTGGGWAKNERPKNKRSSDIIDIVSYAMKMRVIWVFVVCYLSRCHRLETFCSGLCVVMATV